MLFVFSAFVLLVGWMAYILLTEWLKRRKARKRAFGAPFPLEWEAILERNLTAYACMPAELRPRLHQRILLFLAGKSFEGCGGFTLTDESRVTIAAHACLLELNREPTDYPGLYSILVYPHAFAERTAGLAGMHEDGDEEILGESWRSGAVVMAWDEVQRTNTTIQDGTNVALHEFAHQLDEETGASLFEEDGPLGEWAKRMRNEYEAFCTHAGRFSHEMLDAYAATDPAEFIAVSTEAFFEKPRLLRAEHPKVYAGLRAYYQLDPAAWDASENA